MHRGPTDAATHLAEGFMKLLEIRKRSSREAIRVEHRASSAVRTIVTSAWWTYGSYLPYIIGGRRESVSMLPSTVGLLNFKLSWLYSWPRLAV